MDKIRQHPNLPVFDDVIAHPKVRLSLHPEVRYGLLSRPLTGQSTLRSLEGRLV